MSSANRKMSVQLLLVLLILKISLSDSQQQQQQQLSLNEYHQGATHIDQQILKTNQQKIGIVPHDRPSCQLPQIITRRHQQVPTSNDETQQNSSTDSILANSTLKSPSLHINGISTPNVITLVPEVGSSSLGQNSPVARAYHRNKFDSSERLRQLRQLLASNSYDAYLVHPNDEHGSEIPSDYDGRLKFMSGFTGSMGFALILLDRAVLFTDGRYAIQAELELDCNWWLVVGDDPISDIPNWLKTHAPKGLKIATDARLMSLKSYDYIDEHLKAMDSEFALISQDLVDVVWNASVQQGERSAPMDPIFIHSTQFTGNVTWQEKVSRLADSMNKIRGSHYIISRLDDIAWLLNLRGNDLIMSPLFKAFLFVSRSTMPQPAVSLASATNRNEQIINGLQLSGRGQNVGLQAPQVTQVQPNQSVKITMYVDLKKLDQQVRDYLHVDNGTFFISQYLLDSQQTTTNSLVTKIQIDLKDYEVFIMDLRDKLSGSASRQQLQGRLLLDVGANVAIHVLAKVYEDRLVLMESLVGKLKAIKSDSEVQGMRLAHWRDSLAISMLLAQLEGDIGERGLVNKWTETGAASELEFYRTLMDYNKGLSFPTISAYGATSAIVHYKPSVDEPRLIGNKSTFLLDTGGQYLDGTTDITRTTHYGNPTDFQRETYTRVLMGAIDMMALVFDPPARTNYKVNDLISRRYLFELGLDYAHGTGHGIGLYSLCHEQPYLLERYTSGSPPKQPQPGRGAGSSLIYSGDPIGIQENMFTSVEPGYYKTNDFGIRLENIVVTQRYQPSVNPAQSSVATGGQSMPDGSQSLRFEPISLVPFEPKLIKLELLSNKQKTWLNSYNLLTRFRLTQQINYYLGKIRSHHQSQAIQIQSTATSSRLYQHLQSLGKSASNLTNSSTSSTSGLYNFMRLDGAQFQEKLEQTHRWIMSKTELIPLDVPQALFDLEMPSSGRRSSNSVLPLDRKRRDEDRLESQRLMLIYMSGLPFNDQDARDALSQMSARSDFKSPASNNSLSQVSNKCSVGYQCDVMLASALNANSPAARQLRNQAPQHTAHWQEDEQAYDFTSSLSDMFQLSNSNPSISLNMWSVSLLGLLVLLQGVAVAVCMSRRRGGEAGRRSNSHRVAQLQTLRPGMTDT